MTPQQSEKLWPIVKAHAEENIVQRTRHPMIDQRFDPKDFVDDAHPSWSSDFEWRVKPEPRRIFRIYTPEGDCVETSNEKPCKRSDRQVRDGYTIAEFVEVVK